MKTQAYQNMMWNSFPDGDKPEWLAMEQIKEFAQNMGVDI